MKHLGCRIFSIAVLMALSLAAYSGDEEPIQPIEAPSNINAELAELGKKLFFDPRLSKSGMISCNSCHNLSNGGADNLVVSIGHNGQKGTINAPTVLNSSYNIAQFWDGRAETLEEQAKGPIDNPIEMALGHELAVKVIQSIPGYVEHFTEALPNQTIDIDTIAIAIAEFERTLVTPNSRFDQWLRGDENALTELEKNGYRLFKLTGCSGCHNGPAVGGNSYQKMGSLYRFETDNPSVGRYAVTGNPRDRNRFKVPILRNIELTPPYFHDGSAKTLEEAVATMAHVQLNRQFSEKGIAKMVAFLKTLTGEQPQITLPILPPSSNQTPLPESFAADVEEQYLTSSSDQ